MLLHLHHVTRFPDFCIAQPTTPRVQTRSLLESSARGLVGELVRRRWTLLDLDRLPLGVALPLRQGLQRVRSAPPGDWPPEAYVLIGERLMADEERLVFVKLVAGLSYQLD